MGSALPPDDFDVPPEHALLVVDMKGYSQIPEAKMAAVRSDLDDILGTAFAQSGLGDPRQRDGAYKDTGDGAIFVLPARCLARLVDPLLADLNDALTRYDMHRLASAPAIRLRASVHVGPLSLPDHRGDAINEACRLVQSDAAYEAMATAVDHGTFLAAVLSEAAFRRTVAAGRTPLLGERQFFETTAHVQGKPGFEEKCRLLVPRVDPSAIASHIAPAPAGSQDDSEPRGAVQQKAKASGRGKVVQIGGNQVTIRPGRS